MGDVHIPGDVDSSPQGLGLSPFTRFLSDWWRNLSQLLTNGKSAGEENSTFKFDTMYHLQ